MSAVADELVRTEAERRCLDAVRDATGLTDGPMERHGVRCFLIGERIAAERGKQLDREVLLCAGFVHDLGLYDSVGHGGVYVDEGGELLRELVADLDWPAERVERCVNAIVRHHSLREQWPAGTEVEALRLADRVEVSSGLLRAGLSRSDYGAICERVPRDGIYGEVARLLGHALRERPLTVPRIFTR